MARTLVKRILALLLAMTTGFAVPITAVAHGYDHHSEPDAGVHHHDTDDHDHDATVARGHDTGHALIAPGAGALDEVPHESVGRHAHPCLDRARSSRIECPAFALITLRLPVEIEYDRTTVPPLEIDTGIRPRALTHAPPPPPRAPPPTLG